MSWTGSGRTSAGIDGVEAVALSTPNRKADLGIVQIIPEAAQADPATADLVREIRSRAGALERKYDVDDLLVTGHTAVTIDVSDRLAGALLPFGLVVVGLSLILLTVVFRSIAVPVKATLGYLLSVAASFGAVAAVFEWGWLAEAMNVARVGPVISFMPIILMGVLFGLAMDYEVFLVSRMREEYVHTGDAQRAIHKGFTASARVVTAAAVIMIGVFAAFVPNGDASVKPIALGLAVGVFVDAFLVRMTLVPAVLALLGDRAWWLPSRLDRRLPVLDVEGAGLEHHLQHEEWTRQHGPAVVRAEGVQILDEYGVPILAGVDAVVRPGELLLVRSADRVARRAFLSAVAGRLDVSAGRLVVLDRVLPDEAAAVRSRVHLFEAVPTGGAARPGRRPPSYAGAAARRGRRRRRVHQRGRARPPVGAARDARRSRRDRSRGGGERASRRARPGLGHPDPARRGRGAPRDRGGHAVKRLPVNRILVATVLLPMLFGSLVMWSLSDRVERIDAVPAAVVNLDQPVRTGTGEDRQTVFAGRLLAAGLTSPERGEEHSLDWRLTSPDDASDGLREGDYYAVVTIPRGFSETVAGLTRNDPETARITVRSNDSASALVGVVSDQIGDVAAARLNQRITATFLEGMYAKTGEMKASLGEAEQGADRLADGAIRLGEGTTQLSAGAGRLAGGLGSLSGGAGRLADGASELSGGATRLADGTGQLSAGAGDLAGGADRLAGGLERLHGRTRPLPGRTRELADGAGELAEGVDGWSQVLLAWRQACQSDPVLAAGHARLCAATLQAVGVDNGNAEAMVSGSRRLAEGADRLADGTPRLVSAIGAAADGAGRLAGGADRLATGARKVDTGTERLAAGAARLGAGAGRLSSGATRAGDGAARLADGSARVATGTARLSNGSRALATGLGRGVRSIPDIDPEERKDLADAVARPVVSRAHRLNAAPSAATSLAPGVIALALWLGAFVTYLVRRALPVEALSAATSPLRVALAGWLPAVAIGLVQSLLVFLALGLFDVAMESPFGVLMFLLLPAAAFAAVNQAFVAVLGPKRGWMVSIVFAVLQAVSLGGLVPVDTAPPLIQSLSGLLPVSLAAEGIGNLTLGGRVGSVAGSATALLAWGAAALAVTTFAARSRQRMSLSDVRRRVEARPA